MNRIAGQRNIEIILNEVSNSYPINGDYSRIRQMIMIVLDNAVKFSQENSAIEMNL